MVFVMKIRLTITNKILGKLLLFDCSFSKVSNSSSYLLLLSGLSDIDSPAWLWTKTVEDRFRFASLIREFTIEDLTLFSLRLALVGVLWIIGVCCLLITAGTAAWIVSFGILISGLIILIGVFSPWNLDFRRFIDFFFGDSSVRFSFDKDALFSASFLIINLFISLSLFHLLFT